MTIKPILFSGPMVRALLEGRKTQTRRVLTIPKDYSHAIVSKRGLDGPRYIHLEPANDYVSARQAQGTYATGDLLYVREQWSGRHEFSSCSPAQRQSFNTPDGPVFREEIWYWADGGPLTGDWERPRPSIHMPRWASRLTLKVTDVDIQQVQEISREDALAEGVEMESADPPFYYVPGIWPHSLTAVGVEEPGPHAEKSFSKLWDLINAERGFGWEVNPWVAVYTFEVHHCNVEEYVKRAGK